MNSATMCRFALSTLACGLMWSVAPAQTDVECGAACLGDADLNGIVDFGDVNAVLGEWLNRCPPPTPVVSMAEELPLDPFLLQQVQLSPLTQGFEKSLASQGLFLDYGQASELIFDFSDPDFQLECPEPPFDAHHIVVPVLDGGGNFNGFFTHSSSDSALLEGADFLRMFSHLDHPDQDRIRIYTSPDFFEFLDIIVSPDCSISVEISPPFDRGGYLACVGQKIAMMVLTAARVGALQACIEGCKICAAVPTPVTCAACAVCAIGALGLAIGIWWCC